MPAVVRDDSLPRAPAPGVAIPAPAPTNSSPRGASVLIVGSDRGWACGGERPPAGDDEPARLALLVERLIFSDDVRPPGRATALAAAAAGDDVFPTGVARAGDAARPRELIDSAQPRRKSPAAACTTQNAKAARRRWVPSFCKKLGK